MSQVIVTLNKILLFITTTYHSRQVAFSSNEFQNQLPNGILPSVKPIYGFTFMDGLSFTAETDHRNLQWIATSLSFLTRMSISSIAG